MSHAHTINHYLGNGQGSLAFEWGMGAMSRFSTLEMVFNVTIFNVT
jgi:hypothetical protein